jgi:hypothetical protein
MLNFKPLGKISDVFLISSIAENKGKTEGKSSEAWKSLKLTFEFVEEIAKKYTIECGF